MDVTELRKTLLEALYDVAPDLAAKTIDDNASLQETYDLDSADFLNFLIHIHDRLGIDVPPKAYRGCATLAGALEFLKEKMTQREITMPRDGATTAMPAQAPE
jgi:acyl carrier protein